MSVAIENKVALVTGANRGIGKAIVESLIENGAKKVYLAVRNPASTAELESRFGDKVVTVQTDISNKQSVFGLAEVAQDVDIVINNAGILTPTGPLDDNTESSLETEMAVNFYGFLYVAQAFARILEKAQGALVQLNSVVSIRNFSGFATYSISKAASYSLTQALREVLSPKGVKVVSVHPGPIDTDMGKTAGFDNGAPTSIVADSLIEALEKGEFHAFPDEMAKQFEAGYKSYADNFVTTDFSE